MRKFLYTTALLAVWITACGSAPQEPAPAAPTNPPSTPASTGFLSSSGVVASGEVIPQRLSRLSFAVSGPVREVHVAEGDRVQAGDVLAALDLPDLALTVTAAELALKAAELDLVYWIPRLDRPPERRQQAEAEVEEARARLVTARAEFAQASLAAPFEATVVEVNIRPGEAVQPGQVVFVLGDLANLQVETTDLSERDVILVRVGQPANVYIEALDRTVPAKVTRLAPLAETAGGDVVYPVTVELDGQPPGLLWGMSVEVEILTSP